MKKTQLKATSLRTMMLTVLFLIIVILIGGFHFVQSWLNDLAISSNASNSSQTTSTTDSQTIKKLESDISNQKVANDKATGMIVSKQNYLSDIQQDLNKYASDTGVTISESKASDIPATTTNAPLINGVQSNYVSVALKNPTSYAGLIKFIKAIETNIPKMKLMSINISRAGDSGNNVNVEPFIIEVYTK